MMFSTHVLAGGTLGLLSTFIAPDLVPVAVLAGMIGGFLPDLDMLLEHRKTCHRPFQYLALSIFLFSVLAFQPSVYLVFASFLFASMTLHSFMEMLSNGKTMRPEKNPDDRAVYNRFTGGWIKPRRWVLGSSTRDLFLTALFAAPLLYSGVLFLPVATVAAWGGFYYALSPVMKRKMEGYDRFSEYFQYLIGFGPEVSSE